MCIALLLISIGVYCIGIKLLMISIVVQCFGNKLLMKRIFGIVLLMISIGVLSLAYDKHSCAMHWN